MNEKGNNRRTALWRASAVWMFAIVIPLILVFSNEQGWTVHLLSFALIACSEVVAFLIVNHS